MTLQMRIILLILVIITGSVLIFQIRKRNLELKYTLSWMFLLSVIALVDIFPGLLNWLSSAMGIELPINMIFFLGFIFTLLIIYRLTEAISKMSREITELTQKVAMMEKEERQK